MAKNDATRADTYSLLFDVFALGQEVRRLLSAALDGAPMTPDEYAVASVIFEDELVSQTALAAQLSMPLTTVAEYVRTLEARAYVRRVPNPRDGRSQLLALSAEGLEAHRETNRRFEIAYAGLIERLQMPEDEVRRALRGLRRAAAGAPSAGVSSPKHRHGCQGHR